MRHMNSLTGLDPSLPEIQWDFDICALLGQDIPAGETGLDLGHYFDFAQSFFPPPTDPGTLRCLFVPPIDCDGLPG